MMSADEVEHLKSWIGRTEEAGGTVTLELARAYHATLDLPGAMPEPGAAAPRGIHHCLSEAAVPTASLADDGHIKRGGFLPPVPLPRRMWAGGALRFAREIRVGDAVRRTSRIADVAMKQGRTGTLCFVTVEHALHVDGDAVAVEERQDIVYRGHPEGAGGAPAEPAPAGDQRRRLEPSAALLFRYSALTFNAHRIHYDRSYATEVEGYPGLVVHGPMQADLLLNYAAELHGAPPARFSFRSGAPLFDTAPFTLNAAAADGGMRLWTSRDGGPAAGPVAMSAQAEW